MPVCTDTCCRPEPEVDYRCMKRRSIKATRKAHTCSNCGKEIAVGSSCNYEAMLLDGEFYAEYRHLPYDCSL